MTYQLTEYGVKLIELNLFIPADTDNRHWNQYLEWLAQGNEPLPLQPSSSDSENI